jgi:hypothetical protein
VLWTAGAQSTPFAHASNNSELTVPATNVTYAPGTPTDSSLGTFVPTPGLLGGTLPLPVMTGVNLGSNWVEWNPTITVALPDQQAVGEYEGTITHSVS